MSTVPYHSFKHICEERREPYRLLIRLTNTDHGFRFPNSPLTYAGYSMTQRVKSTQGIRKNLRNENDPYLPPKGKGMKEPLQCRGCGLIYWNKRWYQQNEAKKLYGDRNIQGETRCPACRKKADNVPMGLVTLEGSFLRDHKDEIFNLIRNEEKKVMYHNPLERIVSVSRTQDGIEITTTSERLARRLGKAVHRAYSGQLHYSFSNGVKLARVHWWRDNNLH